MELHMYLHTMVIYIQYTVDLEIFAWSLFHEFSISELFAKF